MALDLEKLGELIDGYGSISRDDFDMISELANARDDEIALLKSENQRLRAALAKVELVLVGMRDGLSVTVLSGSDGCDLLGGPLT